MSGWTLKVLGDNSLHDTAAAERRLVEPDRKTAGLLAYLALEGPASRRRLAGLLWPEVDDERARNSLARIISRLRRATHQAIVTGRDVVRIDDDLQVDAAAVKVAAFAGDWRAVVAASGELLPHFDYDDCAEFDEWLRHERATITSLTTRALRSGIAASHADGHVQHALTLATALVQLDPLHEDGHRSVIRFTHLTGGRAAALKAFTDLKLMLRRDWDTEPSDETVALAAAIERGELEDMATPQGPHGVERNSSAGAPSTEAPTAVRYPPSALANPALVGRSGAWAAMEEGWSRGHAILLHGPAGVGKSRLMLDFARSKGTVLLTGGRPGDAGVPYLSLARGLRKALAQMGDLEVPAWVRAELARLLPELDDGGPGGTGGVRFEEALAWLYDAMLEHFDVVVVDDLHFYDEASFEAASRFVNRRPAEGVSARTLCAFRTDEVPAGYLRHLEDLSDRGLHSLINLAPLDLGATRSLLAQLATGPVVGHLERIADDLHRYTGGNPLFVLETVTHLLERERLGEPFPERLPPAGKVGAIIRQRFARLTPTAQRVAQVACVLQSDFDLDMIATILTVGPASLHDAWDELETSGFMADGRFAHDLLFEAVDQTLSSPVRRQLQRAANALRPERATPGLGA